MKLDKFLKNEVRDGSRTTYTSILKAFEEYLDGDIDKGEYGKDEVRNFLNKVGEKKNWEPSSKNTGLAIIKSFAKYQLDNINQAFDKPSLREYENPSQDQMMNIMLQREEIEEEKDETEARLKKVRNMDRFTVEEDADMEGNSLTLNQLEELLHKVDLKDRPIMVLYSYFGVRKMELPTFHNLDFDKNSVDFITLKGRTRVGRRRLYFPDYIREIFKAWEDGKLKLKYSKDGYYKKVKRYRKTIGHEKLSPLTFRHTFRTLMNDMDIDRKTVKYLMGHKQKDVTDSAYLDQHEDKVKRAMIDNHYYNSFGFELPDQLW